MHVQAALRQTSPRAAPPPVQSRQELVSPSPGQARRAQAKADPGLSCGYWHGPVVAGLSLTIQRSSSLSKESEKENKEEKEDEEEEKEEDPFDRGYRSLDDDEYKQTFGKTRKKKGKGKKSPQQKNFKKYRHILTENNLDFYSTEGLSHALRYIGFGDKNPSVNTHLLFTYTSNDKEKKVVMAGQQTLTGMNAIATAYSVDEILSPFGRSGLHTEMQVIYELTGGDEKKIDKCAAGEKLVVDKEVCADCYPFIVRAGFAKVDDGTDFNNVLAKDRSAYSGWLNPFKLTKRELTERKKKSKRKMKPLDDKNSKKQKKDDQIDL
jgi:hypothetical protein